MGLEGLLNRYLQWDLVDLSILLIQLDLAGQSNQCLPSAQADR